MSDCHRVMADLSRRTILTPPLHASIRTGEPPCATNGTDPSATPATPAPPPTPAPPAPPQHRDRRASCATNGTDPSATLSHPPPHPSTGTGEPHAQRMALTRQPPRPTPAPGQERPM